MQDWVKVSCSQYKYLVEYTMAFVLGIILYIWRRSLAYHTCYPQCYYSVLNNMLANMGLLSLSGRGKLDCGAGMLLCTVCIVIFYWGCRHPPDNSGWYPTTPSQLGSLIWVCKPLLYLCLGKLNKSIQPTRPSSAVVCEQKRNTLAYHVTIRNMHTHVIVSGLAPFLRPKTLSGQHLELA